MAGGRDSVGVGDVLGDFRIIRVLGEGGMGVVYLVEDERLERKAALKVIAPHLARDGDFRKRFISEAKSAAAIDHPNAVTVYSSGAIDGKVYIAMRYVKGVDLRNALKKKGTLDTRTAATVVTEIAAALDAAHAVGLVHRDVKPGNILLDGEDGEGKAYLTDFGLTKGGADEAGVQLTGTGQWVGTLDYVAPEQIQGGKVDARTDVYALGCVLYEMVVGKVPYAGNEMQKMWGHVNEPLPALDSTAELLEPVIARATAKDPDDRYPSAGDLARAASAAARGEAFDGDEESVATGAAAEGMPETVKTRTLPQPADPDPGMAPTVAGRPDLPPPAGPPPRRPPPAVVADDGGGKAGSGTTQTAAIIGGAVMVAAALLAAAVVIAGGGNSSESKTTSVSTNEGRSAQRENGHAKREEGERALPDDAEKCGGGVWVRSETTTCPFGINVANAYRSGGGAGTVEAYSPVTQRSYVMRCAGDNPIICTGGREAAVYIVNG